MYVNHQTDEGEKYEKTVKILRQMKIYALSGFVELQISNVYILSNTMVEETIVQICGFMLEKQPTFVTLLLWVSKVSKRKLQFSSIDFVLCYFYCSM